MSTQRAKTRSIAGQLALFSSLLLILTGLTVSWAGYEVARRIIRDQIHEHLRIVALDRRELASEYVDRQKERVALVASRTRLRGLVDEYLSGSRGEATMRSGTERILKDALQSTDDFRAISFVDTQGRVLTTTDGEWHEHDFSTSRAFQFCVERRNSKLQYMGVPFLRDERLTAHLAAPAILGDRLLGVVIVSLDVERFAVLLRGGDSEDAIGKTVELLVGRRDGDRVHYLIPRDSRRPATMTVTNTPGMVAAIERQSGFDRVSYDGVPVLLYHTPAQFRPGNYDWGLIAKMDVAEAYRSLADFRSTLLIVQLGLLCCGVLATFALASGLTRPVARLNRAAQTLAAGDLTARVEIHRLDELGELAATFNQMATNLDELNAGLEAKVQGRTEELAAARDAAEAANQALQVKAAELQRSNTDLQEFAYVASHDLQEPLRAVIGFAELLQQRYADRLDPQAQEFVVHIVDGGQRMQAMIHSLLEYAQVETRADQFEAVSCRTAVDVAMKNLQVAIEENQAEIRIGELPVVHGDRMQLARVFQNLIGNAMKFRSDPSPVVEIDAEPEGSAWKLSVRDNGIGLKQAYAERIFRVFQRLHSRDEYEGTGIGLSICQRIVQRHGGRIWVESSEGQGATFFLTLPTAKDRLTDAG